ncbi:hypothetical protein ANTPLA_LOCUS9044 [Anthophora plagiata]
MYRLPITLVIPSSLFSLRDTDVTQYLSKQQSSRAKRKFAVHFPGECILTYMEFQLDSAEYCQAQHK